MKKHVKPFTISVFFIFSELSDHETVFQFIQDTKSPKIARKSASEQKVANFYLENLLNNIKH